MSETRENGLNYGGRVDRMEGGRRGRGEGKGRDFSTHMTHSTTPSLLHWTHLNTVRRPVRFFLATFFEDWERIGARNEGGREGRSGEGRGEGRE